MADLSMVDLELVCTRARAAVNVEVGESQQHGVVLGTLHGADESSSTCVTRSHKWALN